MDVGKQMRLATGVANCEMMPAFCGLSRTRRRWSWRIYATPSNIGVKFWDSPISIDLINDLFVENCGFSPFSPTQVSSEPVARVFPDLCQQGGLLQLGSRWYSRPAAGPAAVRLECRCPFGLLSEAVRTHNPIAS